MSLGIIFVAFLGRAVGLQLVSTEGSFTFLQFHESNLSIEIFLFFLNHIKGPEDSEGILGILVSHGPTTVRVSCTFLSLKRISTKKQSPKGPTAGFQAPQAVASAKKKSTEKSDPEAAQLVARVRAGSVLHELQRDLKELEVQMLGWAQFFGGSLGFSKTDEGGG